MTTPTDDSAAPSEAAPPPPSRRLRATRVIQWVLAVGLLLLPLLPWVDIPTAGPTVGYAMPPALKNLDNLMQAIQDNPAKRLNPFYAMYLLPIFCMGVLVGQRAYLDPVLVSGLAGTVPFASVGYAFGILRWDLIPLLLPAAWASLGCGLASVVLASGALRASRDPPRGWRNRITLIVFGLAIFLSVLIGYHNRPH